MERIREKKSLSPDAAHFEIIASVREIEGHIPVRTEDLWRPWIHQMDKYGHSSYQSRCRCGYAVGIDAIGRNKMKHRYRLNTCGIGRRVSAKERRP